MKKIIKNVCWISIWVSFLYLILIDSQSDAYVLQGIYHYERGLFGECPQPWWFLFLILVPLIILAVMKSHEVNQKRKSWNSLH